MKGHDKKAAAEAVIDNGDFMDRLILKIRQQWSTVRKAFKDFNEDNDPYIDRDELIFFLNHWGFPLNPNQEKVVFSYFDKDGDG